MKTDRMKPKHEIRRFLLLSVCVMCHIQYPGREQESSR